MSNSTVSSMNPYEIFNDFLLTLNNSDNIAGDNNFKMFFMFLIIYFSISAIGKIISFFAENISTKKVFIIFNNIAY